MSKVLLDTCALLWLELEPARVPSEVVRMVTDGNNGVFLSAVSEWEIILKWSTGKLALPTAAPGEFVAAVRTRSGIEELALVESAVLQTAKLPPLHQDPFDRMLIAQAIEHGLILATPDPAIRQYAVRTVWD